jgi:Ca2+/Na+ antiporter
MNWLRRFFYGRNGLDQLSLAFLVFGALVMVLSLAVRLPMIGIVYYLCMFIFFYRTISRDVTRRRQENMRYLMVVKRVRDWFRLRVRIVKEFRTHVYLKCPYCKQRIRAPRGKGRIIITCQRCHASFGAKT